MDTGATILHADLDVGGGVVLAASYEAKSFGNSSGMSGRRAREPCPHLICVGGHFEDYQRLGDAAINVLFHPSRRADFH
jgi:DNA polymerase-4